MQSTVGTEIGPKLLLSDAKCNKHFILCAFRSLSFRTGMSCVTSWTHWQLTVTSTEQRQTKGSSGLCSGTFSRLLRWVFWVGWQHLGLSGFNLHFSHSPLCLYSCRRVTSRLRPFALGQSAWPLTAGSERGHMMPSESLWALGWTTTYRYLSIASYKVSIIWKAGKIKWHIFIPINRLVKFFKLYCPHWFIATSYKGWPR